LDSIAGEEIMSEFFTKIRACFNRNRNEIVKESRINRSVIQRPHALIVPKEYSVGP